MKPFRFPLHRVLCWRETELSLEQAKLEAVVSALRAAEEARRELARRHHAAETAISRAPALQGSEFARMDRLRTWTQYEDERLRARIADLKCALAERTEAVNTARRRVRLLERLKEKRYEAWKTEAEREIENAAAEFVLAQWGRNAHAQPSGEVPSGRRNSP